SCTGRMRTIVSAFAQQAGGSVWPAIRTFGIKVLLRWGKAAQIWTDISMHRPRDFFRSTRGHQASQSGPAPRCGLANGCYPVTSSGPEPFGPESIVFRRTEQNYVSSWANRDSKHVFDLALRSRQSALINFFGIELLVLHSDSGCLFLQLLR